MRITLPSGTPAEVARPRRQTSRGLVIAPDIWGLRPLFDDLTARLADQWNCSVVTVEPFPNDDLALELEPRWDAVARTDDADRFTDFRLAAQATGCSRVTMIGFCLGGMYVNKSASLDVFDKLVSFYGMITLPPQAHGSGQGEPLDYLATAGAAGKLLAVIGEIDPYTPPADVARLEAAGVSTARYRLAEHAFVHDAARPSHRADDAADAWARTQRWLFGSEAPPPAPATTAGDESP
jgi:carboxymethylenebutenolidase